MSKIFFVIFNFFCRRGGGGPMPPLHHRGTSRSATATPTGSPKRRLPQIPLGVQSQGVSRDRVSNAESEGQSNTTFWA